MPRLIRLLSPFIILCVALGCAKQEPRGLVSMPSAPTKPAAQRALLISDVHFNPVADPSLLQQLIKAKVDQWETILQPTASQPWSSYGSDSNYALMTASFQSAAQNKPFSLVIFTGDILCHTFKPQFQGAGGTDAQFPDFAAKSAQFVVMEMQKAFGVPVILALGNNDSPIWDYQMVPNSPFFSELGSVTDTVSSDPTATKTFAEGGYYLIKNPVVANQDFAVLNTVLWSHKYQDPDDKSDPYTKKPGQDQMTWLKGVMKSEAAAGRKVSFVMHIGPGLDPWGKDLNWHQSFEDDFVSLVQQYAGSIATSFYGHTHMDDFRVLPAADGSPAVAMRNTPSISPIQGNNPGYSIMQFDPTSGDVQDIVSYYADLTQTAPTWTSEYDFNTIYHTKGYTAATLQTLAQTIRSQGPTRGTIFKDYARYFKVQATGPSAGGRSWANFSCAQTTFTKTDFQGCVAAQP
ncbi:MAG: hypothetical protein GC165_02105 [Armatimonadetes bacterium]|nr:hypothetical protein [Armatimonadota bacterium]